MCTCGRIHAVFDAACAPPRVTSAEHWARGGGSSHKLSRILKPRCNLVKHFVDNLRIMAAYADHTSKHVLLWYVHRNTRSPAARVLVLSYMKANVYIYTFALYICTAPIPIARWTWYFIISSSWTWTRLNMHIYSISINMQKSSRNYLVDNRSIVAHRHTQSPTALCFNVLRACAW